MHVLVAHRRLCIADPLSLQCLVKAEVGHHRRHYGIGQKFSPLFHVAAVNVEYMVAAEHFAPFVHAQAAISVAVVGKAHIQTLFYH